MEKVNVLSLDIASTTGWAISPILYGTWDLKTRKDESMGMKLIRFRSKLREVCLLENIKVVIYERPAGQHKNSIIHEAKLIAIVEEFCEENNIDYRAYSAKEIKSFATGSGNSGKPAMIKAAQEKYGYQGNNDNEADAILMLELYKNEI